MILRFSDRTIVEVVWISHCGDPTEETEEAGAVDPASSEMMAVVGDRV